MFGLTLQQPKRWFKQRMWQWLAKRQPAATTLKLQQRFLFVFPTSYGFSLLGLVLLLYLLGTNYQNNLILLQSYFLVGLLLLSIILSFRNLSGLTLSVTAAPAVFQGEDISITLQLSQPQQRQQILFQLGDFSLLCPQLPGTVLLKLPATSRGYYQLPRIAVSTVHPFGLVRCWCYPLLQQHYWVYPKPQHQDNYLPPDADAGELQWSHLSPYQAGDPLQRIDWKRLARQPQQPVVKVFSNVLPEQQRVLILPPLTGVALEIALSDLCAQIIELSQARQPYALQLPKQLIEFGTGPDHRRRCLEALTLC
ncbi:DUF58 domain-containing protein [Rheinheimera riviphila]|uniref:DUF58 domain-containing protein n=1 Tax=Rheinheimera riviphila TaxID=1834037 RepID=A0A437R271_9GAMM|nr:DUF58 domain-containing protein [Rheinheimera riviphila]RVU40777.1 DUF58 domain-containing protein [Rheinheimera riviphila]